MLQMGPLLAFGVSGGINETPERIPHILRVHDVPSVWDVDVPDREDIIDDFIPDGAMTLLTSEPGDGKSFAHTRRGRQNHNGPGFRRYEDEQEKGSVPGSRKPAWCCQRASRPIERGEESRSNFWVGTAAMSRRPVPRRSPSNGPSEPIPSL